MMKKLFAVLFSILCILPCMANIHIRSEAVETVIKQKITDTDAQIAALAEYIAQIKNAGTNAGIPASGVWSVCVAAGWDIKTQEGKSKCVDFGNALIKYANWNFRAVCGSDKFMVERGTGYCIDNVFSNHVIGGTKVNRLTANGLVREYARVKFGDNNLVCSKGLRKTTLPPDDYIQCISMDKNIAYEFAFDSVTATNDSIIASGLEEAICKIFDSKYSPSGVTLDTAYSKGQTWPAACETTDSTICSKINETMSRFGRSAKIGTTGTNANKHTACIINENTITSVDKLRTAFGIDNQVFKNAGIQLNANVSLKEQVCDYVRKNVTNPEIINCTCNDAPTAVYDWSGIVTEKDDVLTCTINGKPVDFLFDDLSESNKRIASGGTQGMSCIVSGGTYSGKRCIGLGEQQCNILRQSNLTDCPECKAAKWDKNTESCILPSSASAQNLQKGINISLIVGGAVVGVALTVGAVGATTAVAGATAASVAATKTAIVLTAIETVGAGIELNAQLKINGIADDFLVKSNKCQSASCAKEMLSLNLQRMANFQNDMTAAEVDAVDRELAKLANLIPDDDELWATMLVNGTDMADNQLGFWDSWEPEQVWRAVGIGLQLASVVAGISKWAISKSSRIAKSTSTIKSKLTRAVQSIDNTPESVLRDKRLELKQRLINGKKVAKNVDNPLPTIPEAKFAAADKWRHPSNPTRIYTTEEMSDIIHRTRQYGGDPSGLTGWEPVLDDVTDAAQSADNIRNASHMIPKSPVSALDNAKQKLVSLGHGVTDFDGLINDFVHNNGPFPGHFTRNTLTDSEFDALVAWFKSEHNLTLGVDNYGILKIDRPTVTTVDPVAAMKAKLRSGQNTSPLDLAKQTPTNNGGSGGYKIMDDGTIIRETPETVTTKTTQAPMPANATDDVADIIKELPSRAPKNLAEEKDVLDKLEDFFSANPNRKPSSTWSARSAAEDAYIKKYGNQLEEIGRQRLQSVMDDGYELGNITWEDLDYLKRERLGISDTEYDFIKIVENWLNLH